jgi:hypothetical protein
MYITYLWAKLTAEAKLAVSTAAYYTAKYSTTVKAKVSRHEEANKQGTRSEGEDSIPLTSSLRKVVLQKKKKIVSV